ncbi:hypothetical protein COY27_01230 [Candidatus Woesearchaeota archaeon CG_4_10_14_0_2_um_filter_33_13]|nr:MAG: hypothetical protein COY27_01230 [Candidatus Woesearchaeota archaeon CG_4_10_14_0_2_um_filter_33_13]
MRSKKIKKRRESKKWTIHERTFLILIIVLLVLGTLNVAKASGWLIPEQPQLEIIDNTIKLDSMTLEQKIAQMVVVHGGLYNMQAFKDMQIGGAHLFAMDSEGSYSDTISQLQSGLQIPFFITVDYEGCLNPFANFINATTVKDIDGIGQAFEKGSIDGKLLHELGFDINFAPVVDLDDQIWGCRSFTGDEKEVAELAEAYILGLQSKGIIATAKHYPGKTLVIKDPHKNIVSAQISSEDIYPYTYLLGKDEVDSVMVSHIITTGVVDSGGIPSVVSPNLIMPLKKEFSGLVISDEINMLGLKNFYPTLDELYVDVFKAGNDLVLNFNEDPNEIYHMVLVIKTAVEEGEIPEEQIDDSVRRILVAKGFDVE